jgi:hypothetical protein
VEGGSARANNAPSDCPDIDCCRSNLQPSTAEIEAAIHFSQNSYFIQTPHSTYFPAAADGFWSSFDSSEQPFVPVFSVIQGRSSATGLLVESARPEKTAQSHLTSHFAQFIVGPGREPNSHEEKVVPDFRSEWFWCVAGIHEKRDFVDDLTRRRK